MVWSLSTFNQHFVDNYGGWFRPAAFFERWFNKQVLAIGNRSRFKKEVSDLRDNIILLYNDGFFMEKGKEYTEGYIKGMDSIIELIAKYEQKELDKIINVSRET